MNNPQRNRTLFELKKIPTSQIICNLDNNLFVLLFYKEEILNVNRA